MRKVFPSISYLFSQFLRAGTLYLGPFAIMYKQPDLMLFFLIFTYLWGKSHGSFRNYGSNGAIYYFLKPETNKDDFRLYFELLGKSSRGRHHSEISKTNTKPMISSLWMRPQECLGCQNVPQNPLNSILIVWSANIELKLSKIWKTVRKHGFLMIFFQFWQFFEVSSILAQS